MKTLPLLVLISGICSAQDAETAIRQGRFAESEQVLNTTINQIEAKSGHNALALDKPLELLAQAFLGEKRYAAAITATQRRVGILTRAFGERAVIVGRVLRRLAMIDKEANNLSAAEAEARRAFEILSGEFPKYAQPSGAQAHLDLADIFLAEDRTLDAEKMVAVAHSQFEASLGPDSALAMEAAARLDALLKRPASEPSGVYSIGGPVTAPRLKSRVEPEYSEEARMKKLEGTIQILLVVDATGAPTKIAVLRPLGMGLDEEAIKAVSQWKFSPGTKNGTPVPVETRAEIGFYTAN